MLQIERDLLKMLKEIENKIEDELIDNATKLAPKYTQTLKELENNLYMLGEYKPHKSFEDYKMLLNNFIDKYNNIPKNSELKTEILKDILPKLTTYEEVVFIEQYCKIHHLSKVTPICKLRKTQMTNRMAFYINEIIAVPRLELMKRVEKYLIELVNKGMQYEKQLITADDIELQGELLQYTDNYKELVKYIESKGYEFKSQNGSHMKYENNKGQIAIIPHHTIGRGLFNTIVKNI